MMCGDSSLYSRVNQPQKDHAKSVIKTFPIKLPDKATVMDAGCGTGEVTRYILQSFPSIKRLIAFDINETFIHYAKDNNSDPKIEYAIADLQDLNSIKDNWKEKFDYIFSFMVFHWLPNQDLGFEFLARCLKPDGSCFISFLSKPTPIIVQTNSILLKHPKWKPYFQQVNNCVEMKAANDSWNCGWDLVEDYIKIITKNKKFHVRLVAIHPINVKFVSDEEYKDFVRAICSLVKFVPEYLRSEFMQEYMYELRPLTSKDVEGSWIWNVETLVVRVLKVD